MRLQIADFRLQIYFAYFLRILKKVFKTFRTQPKKSHLRGGTAVAGQALLELAIFGSLILLLLGVLIGYGLRYDFQQQAQQEAFRKALELAYQRDSDGLPYGSASYTVIRDRHIPDPQNPFGVGQVNPIMASASVTRDYRMDATADDYEGLPKMYINLQSRENDQLREDYHNLTTAGLRNEYIPYPPGLPDDMDDYQDLQTKYNIVYGDVGGWCEYMSEDEFDEDCAREDWTITIVDSVEGEILDYDSAIKQARLIMDKDYFIQECERQKKVGSDTDCNVISNYEIETPWYVDGAYHNGQPFYVQNRYAGLYEVGDTWYFPNIENLFIYPVTGAHVNSLGPQPDYTQHSTTDFTLAKEEAVDDIETTDSMYFSTVTNRTLFYNDHLNKVTGFPNQQTNLVTEDVATTRSENTSFTWETPFGE